MKVEEITEGEQVALNEVLEDVQSDLLELRDGVKRQILVIGTGICPRTDGRS